ncbi:GNAT family N-acetyltransferase [Candidatus Bathyarchaeota archaeon]|jgi:GNAT superfamily N-acetyltransferase|nr:GNAT family N-acetyltransferase [Candidatus Bathyarchaeota archaeon]MBT4425192.1 GNAT family N-acetyltransferase [Candidatus Bathyarchaeota archaeon]MBT5642683.1 GNAT family N-acetyltransferase [Candidatus Bathyarchaeota archaeon]MBT6605608.1 GNAT family N-acetyltransferase [Candidatus Bathyarchaeota archaeon]MBT7347810.1 GNAT family N-acetyltransferase [Candidatus Bathyarchaeota archaeon]
MVDIRVMRPKDEGFFMQLMDAVGWGMTPDDYKRMLTFSPEGLFIAQEDEVDLGMVSTTSYGSIAWIGDLVVLPESRGHGIGAILMQKAIDHLTGIGAKSIRLDAVQRAAPLYRRLGFKDEYWSLRYTGVAKTHKVTKTRPMELDDLDKVVALDKSVFKESRHGALHYVYRQFPDLAYTAWDEDELTGYIMAKPGKTDVRIGPWICKPGYRDVAEELLHSLMNQVQGEGMWIGLPEGNQDGVRILESNGFKPNQSSLRMCYGDLSVVENVEAVFALGGADKG